MLITLIKSERPQNYVCKSWKSQKRRVGFIKHQYSQDIKKSIKNKKQHISSEADYHSEIIPTQSHPVQLNRQNKQRKKANKTKKQTDKVYSTVLHSSLMAFLKA